MPLSKARDRERWHERQLQPNFNKLQPKYDIGYLYPDGRVRLEDMSVVQPKECGKILI